MKIRFLLLLSCILLFKVLNAQTLQSVTANGNSTTSNIIIDPVADAFRVFNVTRLNSATGLTSAAALANNKLSGALTWHPDITTSSLSYALYFGANMLTYYNNGTTETIWRSGNMGEGSGLNADKVDNLHASNLLRYSGGAFGDPTVYTNRAPGIYFNISLTPVNGIPNNNYGAYLYLGDLTSDGTYSGIIAMGTNNGNIYSKRKVAGTWETNWRTLWDSNNFNPANYLPLTGGSLSGDVNIGTTGAQKQLNVNGNIKARKVKVSLTGWADYVFSAAYQLPSLHQLEEYIKLHQHLPGIPTAVELEKEGLDVGDMQQKQMQKIEELTLYLIEQHKKLSAQEDLILKQQRLLLELEKRLAKIEKN